MDTANVLQQAVAFHQAGALDDARRLYVDILAMNPTDPDANHNLGILFVSSGEYGQALSHLQLALEANPSNRDFWINFIHTLKLANRLDDARETLRLGLQNGLDGVEELATGLGMPNVLMGESIVERNESSQDELIGEVIRLFNNRQYGEAEVEARILTESYPRNTFGWKTLGALIAQQGRFYEAEPLLRKALKLSPNDADIHNNLGNLLNSLGQEEHAIQSFRKAIQLNPNHGDACYNLANALKKKMNLADAVSYYRRAIKLNPNLGEAYGNLGNTLCDLKQHEQALDAYQQALRLRPNDDDIMGNLGSALFDLGRMKEAYQYFIAAIQIKPQDANAHYRLGRLMEEMGSLEAAAKEYRLAISLKSDYFEAWNDLGNTCMGQGLVMEAIDSYQRALEIKPDFEATYSNLALAKSSMGFLDEAIEYCSQALILNPDFRFAMSNLLFYLNYHPDMSEEAIYRHYEEFEARYAASLRSEKFPHKNIKDSDRRLKVGYVSSAFHQHSSRHFLEPLLSHHDHSKLEVFIYADIGGEDDVSLRYKGYADCWVNTRSLSDAQFSARIRQDRIDILVDLSGHTRNNRLLVFARKPAPVSLHWLDFGYTTGLTAIDYYLTDAPTVPEGSEHLFSETPWRLPVPAYVYRPDNSMGEVTSLPAVQNGFITFGTLTRSVRINHRVIKAWVAILEALPNARLLINSGNFKDPAMQEHMAEYFTSQGISRDRLEIGYESPAWKVLQRIDISLDCFPHNSGTTLFESLYMGVPFITLANRPSVGTLGVSVLHGLGHPEWSAESESEYVEKAIKLAQNIEALAQYRENLRDEMKQSPLMDEKGFAMAVEQAYRQMWHKWCANASN
jgi:predicted O-linked N-acetylglucosamine transferase (SPINDLY family)